MEGWGKVERNIRGRNCSRLLFDKGPMGSRRVCNREEGTPAPGVPVTTHWVRIILTLLRSGEERFRYGLVQEIRLGSEIIAPTFSVCVCVSEGIGLGKAWDAVAVVFRKPLCSVDFRVASVTIHFQRLKPFVGRLPYGLRGKNRQFASYCLMLYQVIKIVQKGLLQIDEQCYIRKLRNKVYNVQTLK